jgi:hypothetical protein
MAYVGSLSPRHFGDCNRSPAQGSSYFAASDARRTLLRRPGSVSVPFGASKLTAMHDSRALRGFR